MAESASNSSVYETLLADAADEPANGGGGANSAASAQDGSSTNRMSQVSARNGLHRRGGGWLVTAAAGARRTPLTGQPPTPPRKLVKDPSGSARPSFSVEIASISGDGGRGWGGRADGHRPRQADGGMYMDATAAAIATDLPSKSSMRQKMARWRMLHWGGGLLTASPLR